LGNAAENTGDADTGVILKKIVTTHVESVEKVPQTFFEELFIKLGDKKWRI
jgi:hypothetical protein